MHSEQGGAPKLAWSVGDALAASRHATALLLQLLLLHACSRCNAAMHASYVVQRRRTSDSKHGLYDSGILFKPHMLPAAVVCSLMQDLCSMQDSDVTPSIMPWSTFFLAAAWDAKRPPQVTFETGCKLAKQSL